MAVGDWVPCAGYGQALRADLPLDGPLEGKLVLETLLVAPGPDLFTESGDVANVEMETEVLVKRVIGPIAFAVTLQDDHDVVIHERIRVGLRQDDGTATFFAVSMEDAEDANEPFLWERVSHDQYSGGAVYYWPLPAISHPYFGPVDVKVARKLRRQEALYYSVEVTNLTAANVFTIADLFIVRPYLRSWARALG